MKYSRHIKLLYIAAFTQAFILWYSVEKLFMQEIGFTDASIATAVTVMTATTLLAETPAGILADRWSRKGVLILSNIFLILGTLIASVSSTIWVYTGALVLIGIYSALYSGTYDTIIYDSSVEQDGSSKNYKKRFGIFQAMSGAALVLGSVAGSLTSQVLSLQWAYWLTIPFSLLSLTLLFFFKEPMLHKKERPLSLLLQSKNTIHNLLRPDLRNPVLATILVGVVMGIQFNFGQLWYIALALPVLLYGPAYALLQACLAFGGLAADRFRLKNSWILALFVISTVALAVPNSGVVIAGQIILQTTLVVLTIWLSGFINDRVEASKRSGSNSFISTATKLCSLPIGIIFGFISQHFSIFSTPALLFVLLVVLFMLLISITKDFKMPEA